MSGTKKIVQQVAIKPCPFCGRPASLDDNTVRNHRARYSIMCDEPGCPAGSTSGRTLIVAANRWNVRSMLTRSNTRYYTRFGEPLPDAEPTTDNAAEGGEGE